MAQMAPLRSVAVLAMLAVSALLLLAASASAAGGASKTRPRGRRHPSSDEVAPSTTASTIAVATTTASKTPGVTISGRYNNDQYDSGRYDQFDNGSNDKRQYDSDRYDNWNDTCFSNVDQRGPINGGSSGCIGGNGGGTGSGAYSADKPPNAGGFYDFSFNTSEYESTVCYAFLQQIVDSYSEVLSLKPSDEVPLMLHGDENSYGLMVSSGGNNPVNSDGSYGRNNAITEGGNAAKKVVCYFTNWAMYRKGIGKYTPDNIDASLCTHIVYSFGVLDNTTWAIKPHDRSADIDHFGYHKVVGLRAAGVKVLLALGGWADSAGEKYSKMVNDPAARRRFVDSTVGFLEEHGFDGLDLDWEYPKCWQGSCTFGPPSDKEGFAAWVRELRTAFEPRGWLLSAAVSSNPEVIMEAYDVPTLAQNLDWIGVMTFDYHGASDGRTGHHAPLHDDGLHVVASEVYES